jgi:drug/metabolite transporter (DMT)-like permease
MTHCYRFADASIIAAFDYVSMIWAASLGYLVFAETPTRSVLLGSVVVIAAGVAILCWEHQARRIRLAPGPSKA